MAITDAVAGAERRQSTILGGSILCAAGFAGVGGLEGMARAYSARGTKCGTLVPERLAGHFCSELHAGIGVSFSEWTLN